MTLCGFLVLLIGGVIAIAAVATLAIRNARFVDSLAITMSVLAIIMSLFAMAVAR